MKEVRVDKGIIMKRMMPRARGSGARINKRTSHITLILDTKQEKVEAKKEVKSEVKKTKTTKTKSK